MQNKAQRLRYSRILLRELVKTDFKLRYQGSVLGHLWSILRPLMMFGIMYLVFGYFLRWGEGIPHFAVMLLLGNVLWGFFAEATGQGMRAIVDRRDLLRKINFPKYIVVVSATMSALINLAINLGVVLVFALFDGVAFSWSALWLLPLVLQLYIFALAVAFLLSALYVKFRDIAQLWDVLMQGLFFLTPIIYPLSMIIERTETVRWATVMLMSPMAQIIQDVRYSLISREGVDTLGTLGASWYVVMVPYLIVAAVAAVAAVYFRRNSRRFAEVA
ncbi:ABC transporter permease [Candidatus Saccharibacteria bacterium]|nr:ABC transporter permease [Candidatus Saccharibacteria bacterium]